MAPVAASAGSALAAAAPALVTVTTGGVSANETTPQDGISVSADGTLVAFASGSPNLVAGDTNGVRDVFVRNLVTGTATRVSLGGRAGKRRLVQRPHQRMGASSSSPRWPPT